MIKPKPRKWPLFAVPISLVAWAVAVCLVHGPEELALRAGIAFLLFFLLLLIPASVALAFLMLETFLNFPRVRRVEIRKKRARLGQCMACAYALTGNISGVCPECGLTAAQAADPLDLMPLRLPAPVRWAVGIVAGVFGLLVGIAMFG